MTYLLDTCVIAEFTCHQENDLLSRFDEHILPLDIVPAGVRRTGWQVEAA